MQLANDSMSEGDVVELEGVLEQEDAYRSAAREWLDSLMYSLVIGTVLSFGAAALLFNLKRLDRGLAQSPDSIPVSWIGRDFLFEHSQNLMLGLVLLGIVVESCYSSSQLFIT